MGGSGHGGFHGNPVLNTATGVDGAHAVGEMVTAGGAPAGSFRSLMHYMGHHGDDAWRGMTAAGDPVSTGSKVMQGATAIASPIAVAGGTMEIIDGINMMRHGDVSGGVVTTTAGGLTAGSGVAGLAGLGGSAAGAALAAPLSAAALGVKGGMYANEDVKERGWLSDREGNDASISEWAAENGQAVDEWVSEKTFGPLGSLAGGVTTLGSSIAGTGVALASLGVSALDGGSIMNAMNYYTGGDPMEAFHQGARQGSGAPTNPLAAFQSGVAQSRGQ